MITHFLLNDIHLNSGLYTSIIYGVVHCASIKNAALVCYYEKTHTTKPNS